MIDVQLEKFQGPLHLLLQLIQKEELDITEISLATVAIQYIEYIQNSPDIDPEEIADFLIVASKLLLIKSAALLPYIDPEEEQEIDDFEAQLRMYREFLEASKKVEAMIEAKRFTFARPFNLQAILSSAHLFCPPQGLTAVGVASIFQEIIDRLKPQVKLEETRLEKKVSLEEKIFSLRQEIFHRLEVKFSRILQEAESKTEVVVVFLALLELVKQREASASQETLFAEILISKY